ncbi:MAG: potassium channel family protein [Solirubrobacteraceae bacterium]
MWWAVETVTTVGYGDIVPNQTVGKIIGCFLMLGGLSLISVVTAAIRVASCPARRSCGEPPERTRSCKSSTSWPSSSNRSRPSSISFGDRPTSTTPRDRKTRFASPIMPWRVWLPGGRLLIPIG